MVRTDITTVTGRAGTTVEREGERGGGTRERETDPETTAGRERGTEAETEREGRAMTILSTINPVGAEAEMAVIDAKKCVVM